MTEIEILRSRLFAIARNPNHPQRREWRSAMRHAANEREDAEVYLGVGNGRIVHDLEKLRAIVARAEGKRFSAEDREARATRAMSEFCCGY